MESTAVAHVDFSAFLSLAALAMLLAPVYHAREAPREDQLLVETRFACLLATRPKVTTSGLLKCANFGRRRVVASQNGMETDCVCCVMAEESVLLARTEKPFCWWMGEGEALKRPS